MYVCMYVYIYIYIISILHSHCRTALRDYFNRIEEKCLLNCNMISKKFFSSIGNKLKPSQEVNRLNIVKMYI